MSKITQAVEVARRWAADPAHGYDQNNRWGPDYDCSSFLISVWEEVGVGVKGYGATWTGNMRSAFLKAGFTDVTDICELNMGAGLQAGDILLNESCHTEMYLGDGMLVGAASNEFGGITGGQSGDQTGGEIRIRPWYRYSHGWDCVLRYGEETVPTTSSKKEDETGSYTVQSGDGWWRIAKKVWGSGELMYELARLNGKTVEDMLHPGMVLRLRGGEEKNGEAAERARLEREAALLGGRILWP